VPILLGALDLAAGMVAGVTPWRSTALFFALVITWAAVTGLVELLAGIRARRAALGAESPRDAMTIGVLTLVLAAGTAVVPAGYALNYSVEGAGTFTLTGTVIAVGIFGGYAAIVAVFLGIAGFSPRKDAVVANDRTEVDA
jgi:hypothetical protein